MRIPLYIGLLAIAIGMGLYFLTPLDVASYVLAVLGLALAAYDVLKERQETKRSITQDAEAEGEVNQTAAVGDLLSTGDPESGEDSEVVDQEDEFSIKQSAKGKSVKQVASGGDIKTQGKKK